MVLVRPTTDELPELYENENVVVNDVKALICVPQVKEEEEVTYSTVKTAVQTGSRRWSQLPLQLRQQTRMNQREWKLQL